VREREREKEKKREKEEEGGGQPKTKRREWDTEEEMKKIPGNEEAKWEGKAERRDEKLDLQICLDYYEIARLPVGGAQPLSRYCLTILLRE